MAQSKKSAQHQHDGNAAVFEEFFQDYHKHRRQVYAMNFFRGIWFGLGSVLGGTLVLAIILWMLSLFQEVPFVSDIVNAVQNSIEAGRK